MEDNSDKPKTPLSFLRKGILFLKEIRNKKVDEEKEFPSEDLPISPSRDIVVLNVHEFVSSNTPESKNEFSEIKGKEVSVRFQIPIVCFSSSTLQRKLKSKTNFGDEIERELITPESKYCYGNMFLNIQLANETGTEVYASSEPIDLFSFERNVKKMYYIPIFRNHKILGKLRVAIGYQVGALSSNLAATLIFSAVYSKDELMLSHLMKFYESAIDVNLQDKWVTPLGYASQLGKLRMVQKIIDLGANVNASDVVGLTAILRAAHNNKFDVIKLLLKNKADPFITDSKGNCVPHYCYDEYLHAYVRGLIYFAKIYRIRMITCCHCQYLHFPLCQESEQTKLQTIKCTCPIPKNCELCGKEMPESCSQFVVSSQEEIEYLRDAFASSLGDVCDHPIIYCKSSGFPGTRSKGGGSELVTWRRFNEEALEENKEEPMEIPFHEVGRRWFNVGSGHHHQCTIPCLSVFPTKLSRKQAKNLIDHSPKTEIFHWDDIELNSKNYIELCDHNILESIIVSLSNISDIGKCAGVCKKMNSVTKRYSLWARLLKKHYWKELPSSILSSPWEKVRDTFIHCRLLNEWVKDALRSHNFEFATSWKETLLTANWWYDNMEAITYDGLNITWNGRFNLSIEFSDCAVTESIKFSTSITFKYVKNFLESIGITGVEIDIPGVKEESVLLLYLRLKREIIDQIITPYFQAMAPDVYNLLQVVDTNRRSALLDLSSYEFDKVELTK